MPKKLLVSSGERIDLEDFNWGSSGYSAALTAANNTLILKGQGAKFLSGFRVQLLDQTTYPGQITIFNGAFVDKSGNLVTNEDLPNASQTITLSGTNQTFYIEVVVAEAASDVDDRAIWDDSFDNGVGNLPGKEFIDSLSTRTSVTWNVVTPVSTTGFELTTNADSVKIPLISLATDSVGRITTTVNPTMSTAVASSISVVPFTGTDVTIQVKDTTILPSTGSLVITPVSGTGSQTRSISSIDRINNRITFTAPVTASSLPGARISDADTSRVFIKENTSIDAQDRLFSGEEKRGRALYTSKEDVTKRDDLNVSTLKDYVDYLAAQIRELKTGTSIDESTEPTGKPPTSNFSALKHYDFVGSLAGSKSVTFTIGDGVNSLGDFNGVTLSAINSALTHAYDAGYTFAHLVVKRGTYSFSSAANIQSKISFLLEGESSGLDTVVFSNTTDSTSAATPFSGFTPSLFAFKNIKFQQTTLTANGVIQSSSELTVLLEDCTFDNIGGAAVRLFAISGNSTLKINNCKLEGSTSNTTNLLNISHDTSGYIHNSSIISKNTSSTGAAVSITRLKNFSIDNSVFTISTLAGAILSNGTGSSNVSINNSTVTHSGSGSSTAYIFNFTSATGLDLNNVRCTATASSNSVKFLKINSGTAIHVNNCYMSNSSFLSAVNAAMILVTSGVSDFQVNGGNYGITAVGSNLGSVIFFELSNLVGATVTNALFTLGSSNLVAVRNLESDVNGLKISNNTVDGGAGLFWSEDTLSSPALSTLPSVSIENNTYNGKDTARTFALSGVSIIRFNDYTHINVCNNTFTGLNSSVSASGISVSSAELSGTSGVSRRATVNICNNSVDRISGTSSAIGINVSSVGNSKTVVSNNIVAHITGGTLTLGISTDNCINSIVSDNQLAYINGDAAATGIYVGNSVELYNVSGNLIDTVDATDCIGIHINSPGTSSKGNVSSNTISAVSTSAGTKYGIYSVNTAFVSIANNVLYNCGNISLYVRGTSSGDYKGVVVSNNTVRCTSAIGSAIFIDGDVAGTAKFVSTSVCGNTVVDYSTGSSSTGAIHLDNCTAATVSSNTINEASSVSAPSHGAILLENCNGCSVTSNSISGTYAIATTNRFSIKLSSCTYCSISSNSLLWNGSTTGSGVTEVHLVGGSRFTVSSNLIQGSGSAGTKYAVTADTVSGAVISANLIAGVAGVAQVLSTASSNIVSDTGSTTSGLNLNLVV